MKSTSCYSFAPIEATTPIIMTTLTSITYLSSSIYSTSSVTFNDDPESYITVDINQSNII